MALPSGLGRGPGPGQSPAQLLSAATMLQGAGACTPSWAWPWPWQQAQAPPPQEQTTCWGWRAAGQAPLAAGPSGSHSPHTPTNTLLRAPPRPTHVVQQKQHLYLCQAPAQTLAHPKAKGQVVEVQLAVQPALREVALRIREQGWVSAHWVQIHVDRGLWTGAQEGGVSSRVR